MATISSTGATLSAEMQRYYDKVFLERLQNFQKYNFLAVQKSLPKNSGQIIYFTRVTQLTANTTALTDGTSPTGINSTSSNVIATAKPYGAWEQIASLYEMTTIDNGLKEHVEVMAQNAGESMDLVLGKELCTSGNHTVQCANSVQVSAITTTDTVSVSGLRLAVSTLKKNLAPKWENGNYRGVLNVDAIYQLQGDTAAGNWINVGLYTKSEEMLKKGVIGSLYGVDIVETNQAFCASQSAAEEVPGTLSAASRISFIAGKGAVAEVKISGLGDARIIHKKSDSSDTSNPLEMYSTLGWKVDAYAAKVLNANWIIGYKHYGIGTANSGT
jgi:N4-gp56 family major capsid protein